jgi:isoleucyl-tRNA synthetase
MVAVATKGAAPYRAVITHGFVLDGEGRKMSKSEGNVVDPVEVCERLGADVLRLWVASTEYFEDVRLSDEILKFVADAYRQIRNTLRFMLGNLGDFDPTCDAVDYADLPELDRWMLARLQEYLRYCLRAYEQYEYHLLYHETRRFCNVELSAFYLDVLKDRLYASAPNARGRRAAQTVLYEVSRALTRLLAPILVHTMEEVWQRLPVPDKAPSVHLTEFPTVREEWLDRELLERYERLIRLREAVNRAVEQAKQERRIPNPQSARVRLYAAGELYAFLRHYPTDPMGQLEMVIIAHHIIHQHPSPRLCQRNGTQYIGRIQPTLLEMSVRLQHRRGASARWLIGNEQATCQVVVGQGFQCEPLDAEALAPISHNTLGTQWGRR